MSKQDERCWFAKYMGASEQCKNRAEWKSPGCFLGGAQWCSEHKGSKDVPIERMPHE